MNDLNFADKFRCGTQGGVEQKYNYYDDGTGVRGLIPEIKAAFKKLKTAVSKLLRKNA